MHFDAKSNGTSGEIFGNISMRSAVWLPVNFTSTKYDSL